MADTKINGTGYTVKFTNAKTVDINKLDLGKLQEDIAAMIRQEAKASGKAGAKKQTSQNIDQFLNAGTFSQKFETWLHGEVDRIAKDEAKKAADEAKKAGKTTTVAHSQLGNVRG